MAFTGVCHPVAIYMQLSRTCAHTRGCLYAVVGHLFSVAVVVLLYNHGPPTRVAITPCIEAQGMGIKLGDIPNGMPALCHCSCVPRHTFLASVLLMQVAQVARPHQCAHGAQRLHPARSRAPPDQDPRQRRVPRAAAPGAVQAAGHRELAQEGHPRLLRLDVCG